jgi:hypothetical protein
LRRAGDKRRETSFTKPVEKDVLRHYILWTRLNLLNHLPFITENGFVGMAKKNMRIGDMVVVLLGTRLPSMLRPAESGFYHLLESCYVHEAMDGEIAGNDGQEQDFRIL